MIIANIIVYIILQIGGDPAYLILGQQSQLVFQGWVWQLFTSMFVHFDILHILFNMFALYYFGRLNEAHFSDSQYFAIYFGSGLLGNVMSLFLLGPTDLSGGASGAIFGLVGSYVAIARKAQHMGVALLYAAIIFIESSGEGVNIFAHLFGLVGGLVLGLYFANRQTREYSTGYSVTT
ncbi:MAG: rhomboid family intramembrane serine protease [Candidatus Bathyarchaeia archaeon]